MVVLKMSIGQLESYGVAVQFDYETFLASTFVPILRNHRNWTVFLREASLLLLMFQRVENLAAFEFFQQNRPRLSIVRHLAAPIVNSNSNE